MSHDTFAIDGEMYLRIETVALVYRVEVVWLREVVDAGLLGDDVTLEPTPAIAAVRMDHVATIIRMHRVLGLDVEAIRLALGDDVSNA